MTEDRRGALPAIPQELVIIEIGRRHDAAPISGGRMPIKQSGVMVDDRDNGLEFCTSIPGGAIAQGARMTANRIVWAAAFLLALAGLAGCTASEGGEFTGHERIVGLPCEGCEAVFEGIPDKPGAAARIAPPEEPGEPLRIVGTVRHPNGSAAPGTIVYAYQTNVEGLYPVNARYKNLAAYRHGMLRGWAEADVEGRYRFDTVRPAAYPDSDLPQHVHMHVIEPGRCTYYIDDIVFRDDPKLTPAQLAATTHGRGGSGVVVPEREEDGTWVVTRDIVLGEGIPNYPARPAALSRPAG